MNNVDNFFENPHLCITSKIRSGLLINNLYGFVELDKLNRFSNLYLQRLQYKKVIDID